MKKLFFAMEDLWVAVAFAEAGVYSSLMPAPHYFCKEAVRVHAV